MMILLNTIAVFDPSTGELNTINATGIDISPSNGLDISSTSEIMYLASPVSESATSANLYSVDKNTALVSLIGGIDDGLLVRGMTAAPIASAPEPTTMLLLGLGLAGLAGLRRKMK
jgi:hypothetical protein